MLPVYTYVYFILLWLVWRVQNQNISGLDLGTVKQRHREGQIAPKRKAHSRREGTTKGHSNNQFDVTKFVVSGALRKVGFEFE